MTDEEKTELEGLVLKHWPGAYPFVKSLGLSEAKIATVLDTFRAKDITALTEERDKLNEAITSKESR